MQPAIPVQAAVEASAAGGRVISGPKYVPGCWDLDESEEEYVASANTYDTSIVDYEPKVTRVFSPSPVLPSSVCSPFSITRVFGLGSIRSYGVWFRRR